MRPRSRKQRRRERTEVSCCIKYLMFAFNVVFWLFGAALLAIGLWAWAEKDTLANISKLTNIALDPALIFIIIGLTMFIIGFAGCVGSLRENTCLLLFFMIALSIIFVLELLLGILGFVYKDWVRDQIESQVKKMIVNYRDDADLQNLVDWVQQDWLGCCGVHRYKDWEANIYFNCSSPGVEACGVPFSCCKHTDIENEMEVRKDDVRLLWLFQEVMVNRHCGYDMMKLRHEFNRNIQIYTTGCVPAGEKWLESNLIPVAGVAVGVALLQILGICFAQNLRSDINAQRAKWSY